MHEAIDQLAKAIDAVRPHLDNLADIKASIERKQAELGTLRDLTELQQRTLQGIQSEIDSKRTEGQKLQRDEIETRQLKLRGLVSGIQQAEAELKDLQTKTHAEHARWQDLARKAGKLEQSIG